MLRIHYIIMSEDFSLNFFEMYEEWNTSVLFVLVGLYLVNKDKCYWVV